MARIPTLEEALLNRPADLAEQEDAQREALRSGWGTAVAPAHVQPRQPSTPALDADPLAAYNMQERDLIKLYSRTMIGQVSPHTGELCVDIESVLRHAKADYQWQIDQEEQRRVANIEKFGTPDERRALRESRNAQSETQKSAEAARREQERAARKAAKSNHAQRLEQARQSWRTAVSQRNHAILQWDEYVRRLHDEFKSIKLEGEQ